MEIRTERLLLRRWRDGDDAVFAALNADPLVMEHFDGAMEQAASQRFAARVRSCFEERGYGLWAVELPGEVSFVGFVGLWPAEFDAPFTPAVEVGWRLASAHWGHGYATEAARASVRDGFDRLALDEIVSMTVPANRRSIRVMEKLGMRRDPVDDFDHPVFPEGHRLRRHVLYRLRREEWDAAAAS